MQRLHSSRLSQHVLKTATELLTPANGLDLDVVTTSGVWLLEEVPENDAEQALFEFVAKNKERCLRDAPVPENSSFNRVCQKYWVTDRQRRKPAIYQAAAVADATASPSSLADGVNGTRPIAWCQAIRDTFELLFTRGSGVHLHAVDANAVRALRTLSAADTVEVLFTFTCACVHRRDAIRNMSAYLMGIIRSHKERKTKATTQYMRGQARSLPEQVSPAPRPPTPEEVAQAQAQAQAHVLLAQAQQVQRVATPVGAPPAVDMTAMQSEIERMKQLNATLEQLISMNNVALASGNVGSVVVPQLPQLPQLPLPTTPVAQQLPTAIPQLPQYLPSPQQLSPMAGWGVVPSPTGYQILPMARTPPAMAGMPGMMLPQMVVQPAPLLNAQTLVVHKSPSPPTIKAPMVMNAVEEMVKQTPSPSPSSSASLPTIAEE